MINNFQRQWYFTFGAVLGVVFGALGLVYAIVWMTVNIVVLAIYAVANHYVTFSTRGQP